METTTGTTAPPPPYVAHKTFRNFLASLRASGLPDRIDRSVVPGLSGASQSYLFAALKYFRLISEDGTPSPVLKELVEKPENEKAILATVIKQAYGFIFDGLNIQSATEGQFAEKFRERGLTGETQRKGLSLFVLLCESAGIALSKHLKVKRAPSSAGNGTRRPRKRRFEEEEDEGLEEPPAPPQKTMEEMLLAKFPEFNPTWDAAMQSQWFASFEQFMKSVKSAKEGQQ